MEDPISILYEGGVRNCAEGAFRLHRQNSGGRIVILDCHFYYFSPDATEYTMTQNLGTIYVRGENKGARWPALTLREAMVRGADDTKVVIKGFETGVWQLEKALG